MDAETGFAIENPGSSLGTRILLGLTRKKRIGFFSEIKLVSSQINVQNSFKLQQLFEKGKIIFNKLWMKIYGQRAKMLSYRLF